MKKLIISVAGCVLLLAFFVNAAPVNSGEAIGYIGQRLLTNQSQWIANEAGYHGQIMLGLIEAYRKTGNVDYLDAAQDAADEIYTYSYGGYYGLIGDEAGAFAELAEVTGNTSNHHILNYFYNTFIDDYPGGLTGYLADFDDYVYSTGGDDSTVVYYLAGYYRGANAAVANVSSSDLAIWKNELITKLQGLNDNNGFAPVMAVGAAVWALAQAGELNSSTVIWSNMTIKGGSPADIEIASLPAFLATRIVLDTDQFYNPNSGWQTISPNPYAGGFYQGLAYEEVAGFTEDSAMALLGISKALNTYNSWSASQGDLSIVEQDLADIRDSAREGLFKGIGNDGVVYNHLFDPDTAHPYYFFAADALSAVSAAVLQGDGDLDDVVDSTDIVAFMDGWLSDSTEKGYWENVSDLNNDLVVDLEDFAIASGEL